MSFASEEPQLSPLPRPSPLAGCQQDALLSPLEECSSLLARPSLQSFLRLQPDKHLCLSNRHTPGPAQNWRASSSLSLRPHLHPSLHAPQATPRRHGELQALRVPPSPALQLATPGKSKTTPAPPPSHPPPPRRLSPRRQASLGDLCADPVSSVRSLSSLSGDLARPIICHLTARPLVTLRTPSCLPGPAQGLILTSSQSGFRMNGSGKQGGGQSCADASGSPPRG